MWRAAKIVIRIGHSASGQNSDSAGAVIEVLRQQVDRRACLRLVGIWIAFNKTVFENNVIGFGLLTRVIASVYVRDAGARRLKIHRVPRGAQLGVIVQ